MLVLASGSRYRKQLLDRLQLPAQIVIPDIDESLIEGMSGAETAARLATMKASTVAATHPGSVVIGSDQVAMLDGDPLGKPGSLENARAQLARCNGRVVDFHTAVCVIAPGWETPRVETDLTSVRFRKLSNEEIERYVVRERPLDCAGSFKVEGLGISLFDCVTSTDPSALIGLPLIALARLLRDAGFQLP